MSQLKSQELIPFLRRNSVFSLLDEAAVERLAQKMTLLRFSVGDVIVQEGDVGKHAFLIYSGRVRIVKQSQSGKVVTLGTQQAGDIFGEQAILRDTTRSATVRAAEDVALFRIEQADFRELVDSIPQLKSHVEKFMDDSALRDFLRTSTILESLKPTEIAALLDQLTERDFAAETTILREGDAGDCMFIVRSGQLKVERHVHGAAQFVRYLREGEYFGEWALMTGNARSATVTTLTDTRCFSLSRDHFDALLNSAPKLRDQLTERFRRYQLDGSLDASGSATTDSDAETLRDRSLSDPLSETNNIPTSNGAFTHSANPSSQRTGHDSGTADQSESIDVIPDHWRNTAALPPSWKKVPFAWRVTKLFQHTSWDCGPTALAMVGRAYGILLSIPRLRAMAKVGPGGASLHTLAKIATSLGFETLAIRTIRLDAVFLPAIAHFGGQHFVTVYRVTKSKVQVNDPAQGSIEFSRSDFNARWSGNLLLLKPTDGLRDTEQQDAPIVRIGQALSAGRKKWWLASCTVMIYLAAILGPWSVGRIVDGSLSAWTYAGLILASLWPVLSNLRHRVAAKIWDESPLTTDQNVLNHLTQFATGSIPSKVELLRLLHARRILEDALTGTTLAARLNCLIPVVMIICLSSNVTGFFAMLGWALAGWAAGKTDKLNSQRTVERNTARIESQAELIDQCHNLELTPPSKSSSLSTERQRSASVRNDERSPNVALIMILTFVTIALLDLDLLNRNELTVGGLVTDFLYFALFVFTMPALTFGDLNSHWWYFDQLWDSEPKTTSQIADQGASTSHPTITLEGVEFAYEAVSLNSVSGISLAVKPGQKVAVVGRSGSGKSTLLKLLRGAVRPDSGRTLLGGIDIGEVDQSKLRQTFGVALQHADLLSSTIRENLALFDPAASLDRIRDAALRVGAHEFIESLPLGYETPVGASGYPLPVEQVQRICLARSILHDPPVLVWDEATAAMDLDSERRLFNKLEPWLADRTLIMATRRLHTVQNADLIVVMSHGSIVEQGTHPQLIEARGLYYYLCCQHVMV